MNVVDVKMIHTHIYAYLHMSYFMSQHLHVGPFFIRMIMLDLRNSIVYGSFKTLPYFKASNDQ
jgi:hypothetical protein